MKTIVKVACNDQALELVDSPVLSSGGINENFLEVQFCSKWDGFEKTAVFYRNENPTTKYHVLMVDDMCEIPYEVTEKEGTFYFGVFGVLNTVTRTSEVARYRVVKGAITRDSSEPNDPTPSIYEQLLSAYSDMSNNFDNKTSELDERLAKEVSDRQIADAKEKTERQAEIAVERARLDSLIALKPSEDPTDVEKEIEDIKTKVDGTKAATAGDAVREQILEVNSTIDDIKKESGEEFVEEELAITMNTCYDVSTGVQKADGNCFSTDIIPVYPGQEAIVTVYSGQYLSTVAMFDENGAYKGRLYDAGVNFYYWEDKVITIPKGIYGISLSAFKTAGYEVKLLLKRGFRGVIKEAVEIVSPQIEKNAKDISDLNAYVGYVGADVQYKSFDAAKTSTFENLSENHVIINVVNPITEGYVVGLECRPTDKMISENNDKKLFIDVDCDYPGNIDCYVYSGKGIVSVLHDATGKFVIDLANLEVYHSGFKYAIVGITNPTVQRIDLEVSLSLDQLKTNEYYGGDIVNTVNNVSNKLSSYVTENANRRCSYLTSPNGTVFKVRVDNAGNLSVAPVNKVIRSALFCGNSLLVSNGGSGMSASTPENDYFARICAFLQSRNSNFVYHVWDDEIDGTETAIKADNFAGVFENLTTVDGVTKFLPTLDKYFVNGAPDYISIQLGDNSAQNVDFFTGQALPMLFDYLQTKAPNALIVCMGAWYTTQGLLSGIAKACSEHDVTFVDFSGCKRTETCNVVGATVTYPDRSIHTITNTGVASHPNDLGFEEIANLVIAAIDPYVVKV